MIRAIVKNGMLQPLDPLPPEWREGQTVELLGFPEAATSGDGIDPLATAFDQMAANLPPDPDDDRLIEETLAEQDRVAKEYVRRERGY